METIVKLNAENAGSAVVEALKEYERRNGTPGGGVITNPDAFLIGETVDETHTHGQVEAPRENLQRSAPFTVTRAETEGDGLTLEGYAAVFNTPTVIDSWEGHFTETIAKGAFARTIKARTPVMQFDHGSHPLLGSLPLGSIRQLREDDHGLFVRARLSDNWLIEPVRDAISDGAIDGMSFRFSVTKDDWDHEQDPPARTIREVKLFELGPVVFPAYESTSVGVRARQVAAELTDPDVRADLARIFALGTPLEPVRTDTSTVDSPSSENSDVSTSQGLTRGARARMLRGLILNGVTK